MNKKPRTKSVRDLDTPVVAEVRRARASIERKHRGLARHAAELRKLEAQHSSPRKSRKPRGRKR